MGKPSKRAREIAKLCDVYKTYSVRDAIAILKQCPPVKFDQSVELAFVLGVNPRLADQNVRGTVTLPNGTGKTIKILVFTRDKAKEAIAAGAEYAGYEELVEKVAGGWTDFDVVIATPETMREVGKLGKVLGPRGLMPTPKAGTVTTNVVDAVTQSKAGRLEFKLDKLGVVHILVGKLSFTVEQLLENARAVIHALDRAKPSSAKGQYMKSVWITSTMGPGLKIDPTSHDATVLS